MGKRARGGRAGKTQTLHIRNVFREAERKTVCDLAHREFKNVSQKLGTEGPSPVSEPAAVDTNNPSQVKSLVAPCLAEYKTDVCNNVSFNGSRGCSTKEQRYDPLDGASTGGSDTGTDALGRSTSAVCHAKHYSATEVTITRYFFPGTPQGGNGRSSKRQIEVSSGGRGDSSGAGCTYRRIE